MEIKEWLTVAQILVTGFIGVAAWNISKGQYKLNKEKILYDSFDERYSVYFAFINFLRRAVQDIRNIENELWHEYYIASAKSRFLFDEGVSNYMQDVRKAIDSTISYEVRGADLKFDKSEYLCDQLEAAGLVFAPYLKMTMRNDEQPVTLKTQFRDFKEAVRLYFQ